MLKAIGKFIDTLPLTHLLSLEESRADTVVIQAERYHDTHDLYGFTFVMRGVTESGKETQTELAKSLSADENYINLTWNISSLFTAESGTLFLDLTAYQYENPETNPVLNPPDYLLRYQLPPIEIRDIPKGTSEATDAESYTAFWTQVRTALGQIQNTLAEHTTDINAMASAISAHTFQIHALENRIKILAMTQAQYDAIETPDSNTLYILTE